MYVRTIHVEALKGTPEVRLRILHITIEVSPVVGALGPRGHRPPDKPRGEIGIAQAFQLLVESLLGLPLSSRVAPLD